jgi:hypothetical protein
MSRSGVYFLCPRLSLLGYHESVETLKPFRIHFTTAINP